MVVTHRMLHGGQNLIGKYTNCHFSVTTQRGKTSLKDPRTDHRANLQQHLPRSNRMEMQILKLSSFLVRPFYRILHTHSYFFPWLSSNSCPTIVLTNGKSQQVLLAHGNEKSCNKKAENLKTPETLSFGSSGTKLCGKAGEGASGAGPTK